MSHAVIQHMPIDTILTPYGSFTKTYNINNESDGTNGYLLAFPHYAPYVPDNLNLNNDSRLHYKTVHNYYRKFVDEWLGGKLRYLLGYLKYSNGAFYNRYHFIPYGIYSIWFYFNKNFFKKRY